MNKLPKEQQKFIDTMRKLRTKPLRVEIKPSKVYKSKKKYDRKKQDD